MISVTIGLLRCVTRVKAERDDYARRWREAESKLASVQEELDALKKNYMKKLRADFEDALAQPGGIRNDQS